MKQTDLDLGLEQREHQVEQKKQIDVMLAKAINIAYDVLSDKALLFVISLISAGFFGWSIFDPQPMRIVISCLFTGMVFWPVLFRYMRKK